ncbi:MAG: hypothetical protein KAI16_00505 [Candidatus Pacebacteria bacterium]|nr:hypothetical protein [Candidatus Paceibacterota bacterium]
MFTNNVTKDYTGSSALGEIIIMLLVAFILGWIVRMLWERFFSKKRNENIFRNLKEEKEVRQREEGERLEQIRKTIALVNAKKSVEAKKAEEIIKESIVTERVEKIIREPVMVEKIEEVVEEPIMVEKVEEVEEVIEEPVATEIVENQDEDFSEKIISESSIPPYQEKIKTSNPFGMLKNDDLKIIEGVGPKIEILLKNANIVTWQDLAATSVERIKLILKEGGDRFSFHDPTTWPEQASLASHESWEELQEFQDFLSGGKKL